MRFWRKEPRANERTIENTDTRHWRDSRSQVVGFPSIPKPKPQTTAVSIQTEAIITKDQETAASVKIDVQIQTTTIVEAEPARASQFQPYPPPLFAFFTCVTDLMCAELSKRIRYNDNEFHDFGANLKAKGNYKFEAIRSKPATILHRLRSPKLPNNFKARAVAWNPSGTQLAVGHFSGATHFGWCQHQNVPVTIWSLVPNILKNGPLHEVPFDSCASVVKYHPHLGNLIAVGFYSGEVALLDFNGMEKEPQLKDTPKSLIASNKGYTAMESDADEAARKATQSSRYEFKHKETFVIVDGSCHAQEVTSLQWIHCTESESKFLVRNNLSPSHHFIVSASRDGFIGLWSIEKYTSRVYLERRYVILATSVPDNLKKGNLFQFSCMKQLGIEGLECCRKDEPTRFICSTTGSYVFTGSLLSDTEIVIEFTTSQQDISKIYSPEPRFLFQEREYVSKIICSPYHSHLYSYITLYGRMVIRNLKNEYEPNFELYLENDRPASDLSWSKRPMMFGVVVEKSLFLYDLTIHRSQPVFKIDNDIAFCALAFNTEDSQYVAVTDSSARLAIWKLPSEVASTDITEMVQFTEFVELHSRNAADIFDSDDASSAEEENPESDADEESESSGKGATCSKSGSGTKPVSAVGVGRGTNTGSKSTPDLAEIENIRSQFYSKQSPFGEPNMSKNAQMHSPTTIRRILKSSSEMDLKSQKFRPIIIPNILYKWRPAADTANPPNEFQSNSDERGSSSLKRRQEATKSLSQNQNSNQDARSNESKSANVTTGMRKHSSNNTEFNEGSYGRSLVHEPQIGSTVAEVQIHSASNDSDSINNYGGSEELMVDDVGLKGLSDAESIEIDSNPNSSSNAEDTVIEVQSQGLHQSPRA